MTVRHINPQASRARRVGQVMVKSMHNALQNHGETLAGFALVSWDGRGEVETSFMTQSGPVGRSGLAHFVNNALVQHVAATLANESAGNVIHPDDPA